MFLSYGDDSFKTPAAAAAASAETPEPKNVGTGFIENRGQLDAEVLYYVPGGRATVFFTRDAIVVDLREPLKERPRAAGMEGLEPGRAADQLPGGQGTETPDQEQGGRGCAVWIRFEGASPSARVVARRELVTRYNYFLGNAPSAWRTDVPAYAELVYQELWPGVDIVYREEAGAIGYEVVLSSEAEGSTVRFSYEGVEALTREDGGAELVETAVGSFWVVTGTRGGRLFAKGSPEAAAAAQSAEADNPAALIWSTFLGGSRDEDGWRLALDSSGEPLLVGETYSTDFPTTEGAYDDSHNGGYDVFVAKLSSSGSSLLWSTFLGGSSSDWAYGLALDSSGDLLLSGETASADFPTTEGAYDRSHNGGYDAFVAKLSSSGSSLLWSTFLGGSSGDWAKTLALDTSGKPMLTGYTQSTDFPTTAGAYDRSHSGPDDVFVAKLSSSGTSLVWSTFLGGSSSEVGWAVALDSGENAVVRGYTSSTNFPTTPGAYDRSHNGGYDVFVAKLSSSGSSLLWSTFLGGSSMDAGSGLALDSSGNLVLTGNTESTDFPTTEGAYDRSHNGDSDVFVAKLSSSGTTLLWSTFLGGGAWDAALALALDSSGNPVLAGSTYSADFPTTEGTYDRSHNGYSDVFVAKLSDQEQLVAVGEVPDLGCTRRLLAAPNPFAHRTAISFILARESEVDLRVFDTAGRLVEVIARGKLPSGPYTFAWDGGTRSGRAPASGVYFVRLTADSEVLSQKIVKVR